METTGGLELGVVMDGDVPVDDVLAVLGSAYDEFAETDRREWADIRCRVRRQRA